MKQWLAESVVVIVDDTEESLDLLDLIFTNVNAKPYKARSGRDALDLAKRLNGKIDLVITDYRMPHMDGIELTSKLRQMLGKQIPIVILTANREMDGNLENGLHAGANDYIIKPINEIELLARASSLVRMKRAFDENLAFQKTLELKVIERTVEVEMTRDATMFSLAKLAEFRDPETGSHLERIREYTRALASQLRNTGPYTSFIDHQFILHIYKSSPLHDIGKVGVPDRILLKPGKLEPHEFQIMKTHSTIGGNTLQQVEERLLNSNTLISMARDIAFFHHEKWDGSGYPKGLKGEEIPLPARIMALADIYDALISKRVYKNAMPHQSAHEIILNYDGVHLDPAVVAAYQQIEPQFIMIKDSFKG